MQEKSGMIRKLLFYLFLFFLCIFLLPVVILLALCIGLWKMAEKIMK